MKIQVYCFEDVVATWVLAKIDDDAQWVSRWENLERGIVVAVDLRLPLGIVFLRDYHHL